MCTRDFSQEKKRKGGKKGGKKCWALGFRPRKPHEDNHLLTDLRPSLPHPHAPPLLLFSCKMRGARDFSQEKKRKGGKQ